jgi:hypothetical protein
MMTALQPLAAALAAAAAGGQLDPGDLSERTLCVLALVQGALLMRKHERYAPDVIDVDRLAVRGIRSLLVGWGASARAVDTAIGRAALRDELAQPGGAP